MRRYLAHAMLAALTLPWAAGCADTLNGPYTTPAMMDRGIVYLLPGIQGTDYHYVDIRTGLLSAGLQGAIKIYPWGSQIPIVRLAVNQTDVVGNRAWGQRIAREIQAYQQQYPGRPVHMIGQSGGGAICVFTAESLAEAGAPPIDGLLLLNASLSADYDLRPALRQCRKGIVSFYNLQDVAVLGVGTAIFGNLDGGHGDSAGQSGFTADPAKLHQVRVTQEMICPGEGAHFADTCAAFTSQYIAPWILDQAWPVSVAAGR